MLKVIRWGKTVVHMVNCLRKTQPTLPFHEYTCNLCFLGGGKNWAGPFFPHPDKVKHQLNAQGYQVGKNCCAYGKWGGEKLSQS